MALLRGKPLAEIIKKQNHDAVQAILKEHGRTPHLTAILVGKNDAAELYAKAQKRAAEEVGISYELVHLSDAIQQQELEARIFALNEDPGVNGVIIQMPLPKNLDAGRVIEKVDPKKDIEGVHTDNLGRLVLREEKMPPCTAMAAIELLEHSGTNLYGAEVTLVGNSRIVGSPLALLLLEKMATTTVTHVATFEKGKLEEHVRRADVVIVAVGKPEVIPGEWIKKGAVVIDIGINQVNGKIVGDVCFEEAEKKASLITPVPGGIGPITVNILMRNVITAFQWQLEES